jgi:hypothetical protein
VNYSVLQIQVVTIRNTSSNNTKLCTFPIVYVSHNTRKQVGFCSRDGRFLCELETSTHHLEDFGLQIGRLTSRAVSRRTSIKATRVQTQVSPCGICDGNVGDGAVRKHREHRGFPRSM